MNKFSVSAIALLCLVVWGLVTAIDNLEERIEDLNMEMMTVKDENLHLKVKLERMMNE